MLAAIWAQDDHGLIGKDGTLPWRLPSDLAFFKNTTEYNTIVMGRKTFDGMGQRLLPNRETIVLTRDKNYQAPAGARVMHSREEVLAYAKATEGITFIIGGSDLFTLFMDDLDILYRTMIKGNFDGDVYMPEVEWEKFALVSISEGPIDEKNHYVHFFETYQRKA